MAPMESLREKFLEDIRRNLKMVSINGVMYKPCRNYSAGVPCCSKCDLCESCDCVTYDIESNLNSLCLNLLEADCFFKKKEDI